ncbi:protein Sip5p [[Candida] anglica]|uniref:Protein Sip5p n=1 Tax=[Candida] anglica TaxID=148631 RepID=A0ABP0EAN3_9ASCO
MGNVPAKEGNSSRSRSNTYSGSGYPPGSVYNGSSAGLRRNTTSSSTSHPLLSDKRSKKTEEKDRQRRKHALNLIVRAIETIDGGFLAPFGTYKSNLDYDTEIVREMIIKRQIAPFYTPLQDHNESWSAEELLVLIKQLPLHSIEEAYAGLDGGEESEDDIDNHKIHKSANFYRRQEQKLKIKQLTVEMQKLQQEEELKYLELKAKNSMELPSDDLILKLYQDATECPICFLYYPKNMNVSRCCLQMICTECLVQIKRLDPHPPHDDHTDSVASDSVRSPSTGDSSSTGLIGTASTTAQNGTVITLISEPAACPYCAMPNFGVTYDPPHDIKTGIKSLKPGLFNSSPDGAHTTSSGSLELPITSPIQKPRRKLSMAVDSPGVITIDSIRPDWESKLNSARSKLARKAATASAIHASNLIINEGEGESNSNNRRSAGQMSSVEERMIQEALRLSLLDEEERQKRENK